MIWEFKSIDPIVCGCGKIWFWTRRQTLSDVRGDKAEEQANILCPICLIYLRPDYHATQSRAARFSGFVDLSFFFFLFKNFWTLFLQQFSRELGKILTDRKNILSFFCTLAFRREAALWSVLYAYSKCTYGAPHIAVFYRIYAPPFCGRLTPFYFTARLRYDAYPICDFTYLIRNFRFLRTVFFPDASCLIFFYFKGGLH